MYTSVFVLALVGFVGTTDSTVSSAAPEWHSDYALAYEKGKEQQKPLAVFVGSGPQGYDDIAREGVLTESIKETLAKSYICVYLDRERKTNQPMIRALQIEGRGLVISDRSGAYQAFHHSGQISQTELNGYLTEFASARLPIRSTVSPGASRSSFYPYGNGASYQAPSYAPSFSTRGC
jgi:hypothetical protein